MNDTNVTGLEFAQGCLYAIPMALILWFLILIFGLGVVLLIISIIG